MLFNIYPTAWCHHSSRAAALTAEGEMVGMQVPQAIQRAAYNRALWAALVIQRAFRRWRWQRMARRGRASRASAKCASSPSSPACRPTP